MITFPNPFFSLQVQSPTRGNSNRQFSGFKQTAMFPSFVKRFLLGFYYRFYSCRTVDFSKKAIFITGCDSGLGYNFALHLHCKGVKVFAGVLNESSLGAKELSSKSISVVNIDVTDKQSVLRASSLIKDTLLRSDCDFFGLVNNAGVMVIGEFEWQTEEMMRLQIDVNVLGPMNVTKHLLPVLRQKCGRIVNVSSHCAGFPLPGMSVYSASKAGLHAFSIGLNRELKKFGIKVVELVPGSFVQQSSIMSNQKIYSCIMSESMSPELKQLYKHYFNHYTSYLSSLPVPSPQSPPQIIQDQNLYNKLESALFSPSPRSVYVNEPPRYFLYYTLFSILPDGSLKDYMVNKFIKMPEWNKINKCTA